MYCLQEDRLAWTNFTVHYYCKRQHTVLPRIVIFQTIITQASCFPQDFHPSQTLSLCPNLLVCFKKCKTVGGMLLLLTPAAASEILWYLTRPRVSWAEHDVYSRIRQTREKLCCDMMRSHRSNLGGGFWLDFATEFISVRWTVEKWNDEK